MERQSTPTRSALAPGRVSRLGRLAHFTARYRWPVIAAWIVLTLFGGYAAGQLSSRWYQSLAVPGEPAYEGGQRALAALGAGVRSPNTVVFHSSRVDVSKSPAVRAAMARVGKAHPGALTSSFFSTGDPMYVSLDRHTTFLQVYLPGRAGLDVKSGAGTIRAVAAAGLPAGISVDVTGRDALGEASAEGTSAGSSVLLEALIGGVGALLILSSSSGRCRRCWRRSSSRSRRFSTRSRSSGR
jgi:putative drug exporter of the RND superfamily